MSCNSGRSQSPCSSAGNSPSRQQAQSSPRQQHPSPCRQQQQPQFRQQQQQLTRLPMAAPCRPQGQPQTRFPGHSSCGQQGQQQRSSSPLRQPQCPGRAQGQPSSPCGSSGQSPHRPQLRNTPMPQGQPSTPTRCPDTQSSPLQSSSPVGAAGVAGVAGCSGNTGLPLTFSHNEDDAPSFDWRPPSFTRKQELKNSAEMTDQTLGSEIREMILMVMHCTAPFARLEARQTLNFADLAEYTRLMDICHSVVVEPQSGARNCVFVDQGLVTVVDNLYKEFKLNPTAMKCQTRVAVSVHIATQFCEHGWKAFVALLLMGHQMTLLARNEDPAVVPPEAMTQCLLAFIDGLYMALEDKEELLRNSLQNWDEFDELYSYCLNASFGRNYTQFEMADLEGFNKTQEDPCGDFGNLLL